MSKKVIIESFHSVCAPALPESVGKIRYGGKAEPVDQEVVTLSISDLVGALKRQAIKGAAKTPTSVKAPMEP